MANEVTTTVGAALMAPRVVARMVYDAAYEELIPTRICRIEDISDQPSDVVQLPKYPKLTATSQTQGTDMTNSAFSPTNVNATAALIGVMITLIDTLVNSDILPDISPYAEEIGKALAEKQGTDINAEAADFSTSVGTSGANLTFSQFLTVVYELLNGKARPPFGGVLHPIQKHDLRENIMTSASAIWGSMVAAQQSLALVTGMPEIFLGVLLYEDTTAASVNSDADRQGWVAPMGERCGLVYAEKWAPRVEPQRDASKFGTELVGSAYYADENGNIAANGGVKVVTDHE